MHIIPKVEDEKSCRELAEMLKVAGFSTVGLTLPTGLLHERVAFLRHVFLEAGIDTAIRRPEVALTTTSESADSGRVQGFTGRSL